MGRSGGAETSAPSIPVQSGLLSLLIHLCEERLVDLHPRVGALTQGLSAPPPGVVDRWVGAGHAAQEHRPLKVELLFRLADTLMDRYHRVVQV